MAKDQNPTATRKAILDEAFNLFYHNGFQATGLNEIAEQAGVSKGAIYNHFASKLELGYAIVDEVLHEYVVNQCLAPYQELADPIEATMAVMENGKNSLAECGSNLGCPLNNMVQEMASIDEGFRSRLNHLTLKWVTTVADSFARAQAAGYLKSEIDTTEVAGFVVSVFEGTMGLVKCAQSVERLEQNKRQLLTYLNPLRQSDVQNTSTETASDLIQVQLTEPTIYQEKQS